MYTLFGLIFLFITTVTSYSTGPPPSVCDDPDLMPGHDEFDFQTGPSPFELTVKPKRDGFYHVKISATTDVPFKGYIIQVQYPDNHTESELAGFPVGDFEPEFHPDSDDPVHKGFNCEIDEELANTVSHNAKGNHTTVTAKWFPPQDIDETVVFRATVVKTKPEFWSLEKTLPVVGIWPKAVGSYNGKKTKYNYIQI